MNPLLRTILIAITLLPPLITANEHPPRPQCSKTHYHFNGTHVQTQIVPYDGKRPDVTKISQVYPRLPSPQILRRHQIHQATKPKPRTLHPHQSTLNPSPNHIAYPPLTHHGTALPFLLRLAKKPRPLRCTADNPHGDWEQWGSEWDSGVGEKEDVEGDVLFWDSGGVVSCCEGGRDQVGAGAGFGMGSS